MKFIFYIPAFLFFFMATLGCKVNRQMHSSENTILLEKAQKYLYNNTDSSIYCASQIIFNFKNVNDSLQIVKAKYYLALNKALLGNIDYAQLLIKKVEDFSRRNQHWELHINALLQTGEILYNRGLYEESLVYFIKALNQSTTYNFKKPEVEAYNYIGKYHHSTGNFSRSLNNYTKALRKANEINYTEQQISLLCKIGKHYESEGNTDKALINYLESLKYSNNINNKVLVASVYNHIGNVYDEVGRLEEAIDFHTKSYNLRQELNYYEGIAKSLKNIGEVKIKMQQYDSAFICFKKSLYLCRELGYKKGIIKCYQNIGDLHVIKKNRSLGFEYHQRAFKLSNEIGYEKGIINSALGLAETAKSEKDFKSALNYLSSVEKVAFENNLQSSLLKVYYVRFEIYNSLNNTKLALENHIAYSKLGQQILNLEKNKHIAELQIAYETNVKEQQNNLLRSENEVKNYQIKRKNAVITLVLVTLVLFVTLLVFAYYRLNTSKKHAIELTSLNKELNAANREKDKLFSIISHELRNPLWWFKNMTDILSKRHQSMDSAKLGKAIHSLDDSAKMAFHLMENLLMWSRSRLNRITLSLTNFDIHEMINENYKLYKSIIEHKQISLVYSNNKPVFVHADKDLINTVIRNLISNAVKFTPVKGKIEISVQNKSEEKIILKVKDSGKGIDEQNLKKILNGKNPDSTLGNMQEKGSGLGLILCKEFTELCQGTLKIHSNCKDGTLVIISLPKASIEKVEKAEKEFAITV